MRLLSGCLLRVRVDLNDTRRLLVVASGGIRDTALMELVGIHFLHLDAFRLFA